MRTTPHGARYWCEAMINRRACLQWPAAQPLQSFPYFPDKH
ncbi:hypothetical protein EMIT0P12_40455 [Pseudomonas sp. IT-P12]